MSRVSRILRAPVNLFKRRENPAPRPGDGKRLDIRRIVFNMSGYNKYGLYSDDMHDHGNPVIREATRRLPKSVLDARNFRMIRAVQLDFLKIYLPAEKWITYEEDLEYRYLRPYIEEIMAERQEIHEFGCDNYRESDWPSDEVK